MRIEIFGRIWRFGRGGTIAVVEQEQAGATRVGKRALCRGICAGVLSRKKRALKGDAPVLFFPVAAEQRVEKAILSCRESVSRFGRGADCLCGRLAFRPDGSNAQADAIEASGMGAPAGKRHGAGVVKRIKHSIEIILLGCGCLCHVGSSPCVAAVFVRYEFLPRIAQIEQFPPSPFRSAERCAVLRAGNSLCWSRR